MTEQKTASSLDLEVLRRGWKEHDAELLLSLYADDAEVRIVDRNNPPSAPFELHGKEELAEYLRDAFASEATHRVENEIIGKDRAAYNVACQYPGEIRVLYAGTVEVRDGKIVRWIRVPARGEPRAPSGPTA